MKMQSLMTSLAMLLTGLALAGCNTVEDGFIGDGDETDENEVMLTADLDSIFAVPEVDTQSDGVGNGSFVVNKETGAIRGTVEVSDLAAGVTEAHIHAGEVGLTGDIVLDLEQTEGATEWRVPEGSLLTDPQVSEVLAGDFYVDVHTLANPDGEIRGQLLLAKHEVVAVELDSGNVVPPIISAAEGRGFALIDHDAQAVDVNALVTGLNDASAAHVHQGYAGLNGDILFDLENTASGVWQTLDAQTLESSDYQSLLAGRLYINVHSASFFNGELRGQIAPEDIVVIRTELDGAGVVPPIDTQGYGFGYTTLDTGTGEIVINLRTYNLASFATGAHLREASIGQVGDIVLSLERSAVALNLWQTSENSVLTDSGVETLLDGGFYLSVSTNENPGGEIRGQIEP